MDFATGAVMMCAVVIIVVSTAGIILWMWDQLGSAGIVPPIPTKWWKKKPEVEVVEPEKKPIVVLEAQWRKYGHDAAHWDGKDVS